MLNFVARFMWSAPFCFIAFWGLFAAVVWVSASFWSVFDLSLIRDVLVRALNGDIEGLKPAVVCFRSC